MRLLHGTSERNVDAILKHGLIPRGKRPSMWKATSNRHCVYMTDAYAPFFAANATRDGERMAIIEVETDDLNLLRVVPDEDFLEQVSRKNGPTQIANKSLAMRTAWYSRKLLEFQPNWMNSLKHLGTVGYHGAIPVSAITRIGVFDMAMYIDLVFHHGLDPFISVGNYWICGAFYRNSMKALFGDEWKEETSFRINPDFPKLELVYMNQPRQQRYG